MKFNVDTAVLPAKELQEKMAYIEANIRIALAAMDEAQARFPNKPETLHLLCATIGSIDHAKDTLEELKKRVDGTYPF